MGDEQLRARVAEERVLCRIDKLQLLAAQLRHRMLQLSREGPPQIDEAFAPVLVGDGLNAYLCVCQGICPVLLYVKASLRLAGLRRKPVDHTYEQSGFAVTAANAVLALCRNNQHDHAPADFIISLRHEAARHAR